MTDSQIKLGCVQPGESVATFGDALRRLTDQATHLYQNDKRYWYSTQPSVSRLAQDRAAQLDEDSVLEEIEQRLKVEQNNRSDFGRVHICPTSGADIADDDQAVRLVLLKPQFTHALRDQQSEARKEAAKILDLRGNTRRNYRNTLIFLTADRTRLEELKQVVRQYKAWNSIDKESEELNLDAFQRSQTRTKLNDTQKRIEALIPETYIWLLVPDQPDPKKPDALEEFKRQPQPLSTLVMNSLRKLKSDEMLINHFAGTLLRRELDRIPLWRGNHVSIKELAENFAKYVYLPRLRNSDVLLNAIREGVQSFTWEQETFAYAERWDATQERYLGLKAGQPVSIILNAEAVLVKPEIATAQIAADAEAAMRKLQATAQPAMAYAESQSKASSAVVERGGTSILQAPTQQTPSTATAIPTIPVTPVLFPTVGSAAPILQHHRFHATKNIDTRMMAKAAGEIMEEVVKHLTSLYGAKVQVTLEIQAELPNGVPADTVRTVTENCRTLRFESYEFEES